MGSVFSHRPEWHCDISPYISRMSHSIALSILLYPILRPSLLIFISSDYSLLHLDLLQVEGIARSCYCKPDILHIVFPVRAGPAPLLAPPGNTILYQQMTSQYTLIQT